MLSTNSRMRSIIRMRSRWPDDFRPRTRADEHGDQIGDAMAELDKSKTVSLQELMIETLTQADALMKLLIEKGGITDAKFKQKLLEERARFISAF